MKKRSTLSLLAILVLTPLSVLTLIAPKVHAADVTAYIDLTADAGGPVTPATITAQPEIAVSTADEFFISYQATSEFAASDTVSISFNDAGWTALALCGTSTTDADLDGTPDGALVLTSGVFTYTFTAATTTGSGATNGVEFCFAATSPAVVGNHDVSISSTNDADTSAALIYVGAAGSLNSNDVNVTAVVPITLELEITDASAVNTNSCNLGVLSTLAVSTCNYRVTAGTNGTGGVRLEFVSATAELISGANTINAVSDGTVTAGSEEYGVTMAGTGFTLTAPYDTGDDAVPTAQAAFASKANPVTIDTHYVTVTHRASISGATALGAYSHLVTYRAYYIP